MITVRNAIIRAVAKRLREYYLRGIRDARVEVSEGRMPSFLEGFDPGDFDTAHDKDVWIKIAEDILGM